MKRSSAVSCNTPILVMPDVDRESPSSDPPTIRDFGCFCGRPPLFLAPAPSCPTRSGICLYPPQQLFRLRILHQCKPEPLLPEVLDRSAYQIDLLVYYQKPVVRLGECPDLHGRILRIMLIDVQLQLL